MPLSGEDKPPITSAMSDLAERIMRIRSMEDAAEVKLFLTAQKDGYQSLMELCLGSNALLGARATRLAKVIQLADWDCFLPFLPEMLEKWDRIPHSGAKREVLRMIRDFTHWPEDKIGEIADLAFRALDDPSQAIAVHVYALDVCARIAKEFPELEDELEAIILRRMPERTPAFNHRAKNWLEGRKRGKKKWNQ